MINKKAENWLELAKRDLSFAKEIYQNSSFKSYAPHYCHQAIEKLIKAIIVSQTNNNPPYLHNLVRLANVAKLEITVRQKEIIASLNPHYIGTKYPEDIAKMFKLYNKNKVEEIYLETNKIYKWLKSQLK